MNPQEEELLQSLRVDFVVEAAEHMQAIASGLLELEKGGVPGRLPAIVEKIYREAHSLKGEARAVNYPDIESLCQHMESIFAGWKRSGVPDTPGVFDRLHSALDTLRALLASGGAPDDEQRARLSGALESLASVGTPAELLQIAHRSGPGTASSSGAIPPSVAADRTPVTSGADPADETIRMPLVRLESLLLGLEEMLSVKLAAQRRTQSLRGAVLSLEQCKREWSRIVTEVRTLPGCESGLPLMLEEMLERNRASMGVLENVVTTLSRESEQDVRSVSRLIDDLLDDSKKLLMLPFNTLLSMLPRVVRDISRDQGKNVDVMIRGGEIEIDKRILQGLKDAVIHLIRNSVDHGIETEDVRRQKNKPARGVISVEVMPVDAGKVELVIRDDGAGIDLSALRKAAVGQGVVTEEQAARLGEHEAMELIFKSAVSTSRVITTVSGRGLGMAIVKDRVEKLGGRVSVESRWSEGATFRIVLPLTLATFRGVFVEVAGQRFIIPSASVQRVSRLKNSQVKTVEHRDVFAINGRTIPLVQLDAVLGLHRAPVEVAKGGLLNVVVVHAGDSQIAFGVDHVLMEEEVLVKLFLKPLSRVRNVAGATVLASGKIVPILNVADLAKSAALCGQPPPPTRAADEAYSLPAKKKDILLVEDSIISRTLLKGILEAAGYAVKTAVDGEEALNTVRAEEFDAVVSDVEMPRMNGFDLTTAIRRDPRLSDKPVILVTALDSRENRERGVSVGASAYIVKSSFDQSDLLDALRRAV